MTSETLWNVKPRLKNMSEQGEPERLVAYWSLGVGGLPMGFVVQVPQEHKEAFQLILSDLASMIVVVPPDVWP